MKKILLCGPRSKNFITGVSLAFDLLIMGLSQRNIPFEVIDIVKFGKTKKSGAFNLFKSLSSGYCILLGCYKIVFCQIYYSTMSTSQLGFIRDFLMVSISRIMNRKIILHLHGGGFEDFYLESPNFLKQFIRLNLANTDKIIVLGELLKDQFYCAGDSVKEKLVVVENGLTLGVIEPPMSVKNIRSPRVKELLYLSSMMESKGFIDVIKAVKFLKEEGLADIHLNLCGAFHDAKTESDNMIKSEKDLLSYLKSNNLERVVTYHGEILGDLKTEQLKNAHIFILPTYYPWEGQPLSIIEAMAFATPVISTHHKGIPELISNGETGYFVEARSPKSIVKSIRKILSNSEEYERLSMNSRIMYEGSFKREVHLEKLIKVLYEN